MKKENSGWWLLVAMFALLDFWAWLKDYWFKIFIVILFLIILPFIISWYFKVWWYIWVYYIIFAVIFFIYMICKISGMSSREEERRGMQ